MLAIIFQPLFWFWSFLLLPKQEHPPVPVPLLGASRQDMALPVCPADLSRAFKQGLSFFRIKMEEMAFREHLRFPPISPAALPPQDTQLTPMGRSRTTALPGLKPAFGQS